MAADGRGRSSFRGLPRPSAARSLRERMRRGASPVDSRLCGRRPRLEPRLLLHVLAPLTARRNRELLAVLRDRAPRDIQALFLQLGRDLLVGERVALVLVLDDVADLLLDRDDRLFLAV